jgi:hypothetical protein
MGTRGARPTESYESGNRGRAVAERRHGGGTDGVGEGFKFHGGTGGSIHKER